MSAMGRNQPCRCGSGKKTKRCCGVRTGPSERELAKAFLATQGKQAAVRLYLRVDRDAFNELFDTMLDLPTRHLCLQVPLPRLLPPEFERLRAVVEVHGNASDAHIVAALALIDTPEQRAQLARAVIELAAGGDIDSDVADAALVDLEVGDSSFMAMSLLQAISVATGAARTPSGLLVATR